MESDIPQTKNINNSSDDNTGKLGTFAGVFTPSILTILGIILFLRLGFVLGNAGLARTLAIICLANMISILTTVSVAAVATNMKIKGGGDYYLISRTLGVEFGGAIGLVLFLAQSVSVAFYCIGFGEAVGGLIGNIPFITPRLLAAGAVFLLFAFAWMGADWATRFQFIVMSIMIGALISFFIGGLPKWESGQLLANIKSPESSLGFWALFAIFFPAATGFTQGISMSGDLKEPSKSLPIGTFLAVGLSIVIYISVVLIFAGAISNEQMASRYDSMNQVAKWGGLIDAGVIAATLSSAMASFLGAPRILQSLASDKIFPVLTPFSKGSGPYDNPRRGVLLCLAIAMVTVMLGQLNLIAPVVSMFFLISYGLLNYATYFEARSESPSFRPRFKFFNKNASLIGFLVCLVVMLAIDIRAGAAAIATLAAIYQYLKHNARPARWADGSRGFHLQEIRKNLLKAALTIEHPRDWRPMILALTNEKENRSPLLTFAKWSEGNSGLTTALSIIEKENLAGIEKEKSTIQKKLDEDIQKINPNAFGLVVDTHDILESLQTIMQSYGIGPLKANTLLLDQLHDSSPKQETIALDYTRTLRGAFRLGMNLMLLSMTKKQFEKIHETHPDSRSIAIFWDQGPTSRLALIFAYLIQKDPFWENSSIVVFSSCPSNDTIPQAKADLEKELEAMRINANVKILVNMDAIGFATEAATHDLAFLPFKIMRYQLQTIEGHSLDHFLPVLPSTVWVMAAQDLDLDAEPEEGLAGESATVSDALEDLMEKTDRAEKNAEEIRTKAEELASQLASREHRSSLSSHELSNLHSDTIKAIADSEKAFRKAAKLKVKLGYIEKEAQEMGISIESQPEEGSE